MFLPKKEYQHRSQDGFDQLETLYTEKLHLSSKLYISKLLTNSNGFERLNHKVYTWSLVSFFKVYLQLWSVPSKHTCSCMIIYLKVYLQLYGQLLQSILAAV